MVNIQKTKTRRVCSYDHHVFHEEALVYGEAKEKCTLMAKPRNFLNDGWMQYENRHP